MESLPQSHPDASRRFWQTIAAGGLVAYPTDTLYGLGVDAGNGVALEQLALLKGRPGPFSVMVGRYEQLTEYALIPPQLANKLSRMLPGPYTFILPVREQGTLPPRLSGPDGRIGFRVPDHPFLRDVYRYQSGLVVTTSANRAGKPAIQDPQAIAEQFSDAVDLLIDGGSLPDSKGSTIIDPAVSPWLIIRQGDGRV